MPHCSYLTHGSSPVHVMRTARIALGASFQRPVPNSHCRASGVWSSHNRNSVPPINTSSPFSSPSSSLASVLLLFASLGFLILIPLPPSFHVHSCSPAASQNLSVSNQVSSALFLLSVLAGYVLPLDSSRASCSTAELVYMAFTCLPVRLAQEICVLAH